MPKFSSISQKRLATVHPELQRLFEKVIEGWDCTVVSGLRTQAEQVALYAQGRTKPGSIVTDKDGVIKKSNHQTTAVVAGKAYGLAVDVTPYPVKWDDDQRSYAFAGYVMGWAAALGIPVRCGYDWDQDHDFHDQSLYDLDHFELVLPG